MLVKALQVKLLLIQHRQAKVPRHLLEILLLLAAMARVIVMRLITMQVVKSLAIARVVIVTL